MPDGTKSRIFIRRYCAVTWPVLGIHPVAFFSLPRCFYKKSSLCLVRHHPSSGQQATSHDGSFLRDSFLRWITDPGRLPNVNRCGRTRNDLRSQSWFLCSGAFPAVHRRASLRVWPRLALFFQRRKKRTFIERTATAAVTDVCSCVLSAKSNRIARHC
jgi:hypothetical protein